MAIIDDYYNKKQEYEAKKFKFFLDFNEFRKGHRESTVTYFSEWLVNSHLVRTF